MTRMRRGRGDGGGGRRDLGPDRRCDEPQPYDELGPRAPAAARRLDRAAVRLDEPLHEREAEPEPAESAVERGVALRERLEEARDQGGVDAYARVPHAKHREAVDGLEGQPDRVAAGGELGRVLEQVPDRLREARRVAVDPQRLAGERDLERHLACGEEPPVVLGGAPRELPEVHRPALHLELSGRDARHVQEVVHEPREVPDLTGDDVLRVCRRLRSPRPRARGRGGCSGWARAGCGARERGRRGTGPCGGPRPATPAPRAPAPPPPAAGRPPSPSAG